MPVALNKTNVENLARSKKDGTVTIFDSRIPGLTVRSGLRKTQFIYVWTSGTRKERLTLGLYPELEVDEARKMAGKAADLIAQGLKPDDDWVRRERNPADPQLAVKRSTWTFAEGRDAYLLEKKGSIKGRTLDDYRKYMHHPALKPFENLFVRDISEELVSETLAEYHRRVGGTAAAGIKRRISIFWNWLQLTHNRSRSGVRSKIQIDIPASRGQRKTRRYPHPSAIRELMEKAKTLDMGYSSVAVMLACKSVQRCETIVTARVGDFREDLWFIPPLHRKTAEKRHDKDMHVIPAFDFGFEDDEHDDDYVFPASRARRKGMNVGHMSPTTMTQAMRRTGFTFTPHDIRRSFTTSMLILKFKKPDLRLILDHNEGKDSTLDEHYSIYTDMPLKRKMMQAWWSLLRGETTISQEAWDERTSVKGPRKKKAVASAA